MNQHRHPKRYRKFACVAILHDGQRIEHTVVAETAAEAELDFADALPGLPRFLHAMDTGPVKGNVIRIATGLHRAVPIEQDTVSTSDLSHADDDIPLYIAPRRAARSPHPLAAAIGTAVGTARNVAELYRFHRKGQCGRWRSLKRAVMPLWHDVVSPVSCRP